MFRMGSGLVQLIHGLRTSELMDATVADGSAAILIILAMSFGLIVPKLIIDYSSEKVTETESRVTKEPSTHWGGIDVEIDMAAEVSYVI
jgi:hypothetical protein